MNRRRLLGVLAGTTALGGCLGRDGSGPATTDRNATTTTDRDATNGTTTDATTTRDADVTVRDVTATPALVGLNSPDSIGTFGDRDEQFVVGTVAAAGSATPGRDAFALDADGETYGPVDDVGVSRRLWEHGLPYGRKPEGWVAFSVPNPLDAERVAVTWPGGEHALDEAAVGRLARPPTTFELREFAAPEPAEYGDPVTVTLTVENVGDADGTFVGALNRSGPRVAYTPEEAIALDVAAGETATREFTHTPTRHGDEDRSMRFYLVWRGGRLSRSVDVTTD